MMESDNDMLYLEALEAFEKNVLDEDRFLHFHVLEWIKFIVQDCQQVFKDTALMKLGELWKSNSVQVRSTIVEMFHLLQINYSKPLSRLNLECHDDIQVNLDEMMNAFRSSLKNRDIDTMNLLQWLVTLYNFLALT